MSKEMIENVVKRVVKKVEKGGKVSISKEMVKAGYSKKYAKNPKKITRSKTWDEIMEKYMPDELAAQIHKDLLKSSRIDKAYFPISMDDKDIVKEVEKIPGCKARKIYIDINKKVVVFWSPDSNARKSALDMFYKLKGKYSAEKIEHTVDKEIRDHLDKLAKIFPK